MQYDMPFESSSEPDDPVSPVPALHPDDGVPSLFTGRPWRAAMTPDSGVIDRLRRELTINHAIPPEILTLLAARGIVQPEAIERFFFPRLDALHDPLLLDEMDQAVARLRQAAAGGERVAVHGDFDVDGLTGTALLAELLRGLCVDGCHPDLVEAFVPDRSRDGYGVALHKIDVWADAEVTLLVTVDTGAAAHEALGRACDRGMDVVVLDHHLFGERPRGATVLVNPRRPENRYPNPDLCGVAVAFKLAQALTEFDPDSLPKEFLAGVLDLVALGLIADQMPLVEENRLLVSKGLERFNQIKDLRPGLAALMDVSGLEKGFPVSATDIAYQLAPRLNACGRVGQVLTALELLLTRDHEQARSLAKEAEQSNDRRKLMDQEMKVQAVEMARPFVERGDPGLVLGDGRWHKGVIGICASRLVELFGVPAIMCAIEGDEVRGSARSVPGTDVKAALDRSAGLLVRYGGHAQAAGLTLRTSDLDAFREAFLQALLEKSESGPVATDYDLDLDLAAMTAGEVADILDGLEQLAPFGEGNRVPIFRCNGLRLSQKPKLMGKTGDHLRFGFTSVARTKASSSALGRDFVCFGHGRTWSRHLAERPDSSGALDGRWDILFTLAPNTWRPRDGRSVDPVQQQLLDMKPTESA